MDLHLKNRQRDLSDVPTQREIEEVVGALEPIILQGYKRSRAMELFPDAHLTTLSSEDFESWSQQAYLYENDGLVEHIHRAKDDQGTTWVTGYFRWSHLLTFYMPASIPEDTIAECLPETRAAWIASTESDDAAIDSWAWENTRNDMERIRGAFALVFEQCDLPALEVLLPTLNNAAVSIDGLVERHEDAEFEDVAELFESWQGDDADAAYEIFGQQLRPAAGMHRQILAALVESANQEAIEQTTVMCELYNAVAIVNERIREYITAPDVEIAAWRRLGGVVLVNRVKGLGDLLAVVDFGIELGTDGQKVGTTGRYLDAVMEQVFPDYPGIPTAHLSESVRDALTEAADAALNQLYQGRSALTESLDDAEADFNAQLSYVLIPGYIE